MVGKCIAPADIQEGDLIAYLEGTAPAGVAQHLARCPACAAELESLRLTDLLLRQALTMAPALVTRPAPAEPRQRHRLKDGWFWWLKGPTWRQVAVPVGLVLLLLGWQFGLNHLFNQAELFSPARVARQGVATVVVTVEETAEVIEETADIIKKVAGSVAGVQLDESEEVVSRLAQGQVIVESLVEIAPPRTLREQIEKEFHNQTDHLSVYSPAAARAEKDRVLTGSEGNSYAVWTAAQDGQMALYFMHSSDGGLTWGRPVQINRGLEKIYSPSLAVDTENDNLYVVWRSGFQSNANIYLARSIDSGHTWSKSVRVSGAIGHIFQPSLTVDNSGGLYVSWQNRDRTNISIYFIHSPDGGHTWSDRVRAANLGG